MGVGLSLKMKIPDSKRDKVMHRFFGSNVNEKRLRRQGPQTIVKLFCNRGNFPFWLVFSRFEAIL